ncbi:hypothetical protein HDU98_001977 [Podochytrium sp. JEL0797]|nr:hypothetical protein HDU98_001977 [Podochytrium sp. JEL0797]
MPNVPDAETIAALEQRLDYISSITTPYSTDGPLLRPGLESIMQSVGSIKGKLNQLVSERRALGDFLQKYSQLSEIISNHTNTTEQNSSSALDLDMGLGLDPASKKEIVLAAEDEILTLTDQLREIDALKGEIDSQAMSGLDQRIAALTPIEFTQIAQSQASAALKEEFMTVLDDYNEYVKLNMKDITNLAKEIASISSGAGSTNWAIVAEDSTTHILSISAKGESLPELRKALQTTMPHTDTSPALVGYMNYNNTPLKIVLSDTKSNVQLAKHNHSVKVLLKNHAAIVNVKDLEKDLDEESVAGVVERVSPTSGPIDEDEDENIIFEGIRKEVNERKVEMRERLNRYSGTILESEKQTLKAQLECREKVDQWKQILNADKGGPSFEGWLAYQASEKAGWKFKWALVESKNLYLYRDEHKSQKPISIELSGVKMFASAPTNFMPNSFELKTNAQQVSSGVLFYTESKDVLFKLTAAIELA